MDKHQRKLGFVQVDQIFIPQAVCKNEHSIGIVRSDRRRDVVAAVRVVGGHQQVVFVVSDDCFNAVEQWGKKVIVHVGQQKANDAGLFGGQVSGSCMRHVP